jgi:hypothetical protein
MFSKQKVPKRDSLKNKRKASFKRLHADNSSDSADEEQKNVLKELAEDVYKANDDKHKQKITFIRRKQSQTFLDDFSEKEDK